MVETARATDTQADVATVRALIEGLYDGAAGGQMAAWLPEELADPEVLVAPEADLPDTIAEFYPPHLRRGHAAPDTLLALDVYVLGDSAWALAAVTGGELGAAHAHAIHHLVKLDGRWYLTMRFTLRRTDLSPDEDRDGPANGVGESEEADHVRRVVEQYYQAYALGEWAAGEALWAPVSWAFHATVEPDAELEPAQPGRDAPISFPALGFSAARLAQRAYWRAAMAAAPHPEQLRVWVLDNVAWALAREASPGSGHGAETPAEYALHQLVYLPDAGWRLVARVQVVEAVGAVVGATPRRAAVAGGAALPGATPRPLAAAAPRATSGRPAAQVARARRHTRRRPAIFESLRQRPYAVLAVLAVLLIGGVLAANEVRSRQPLASGQGAGATGPAQGPDTFQPPATPRDRWPQLVATISSKGAGDNQVMEPRAVAVDGAGNVYVLDSATRSQTVKKFDGSGTLLRTWGGPGETDGKFTGAWAIAVSRAGEVHVLDETTLWIQVFDGDGKFLRKWGGPSLGAYHPRAMTIDATDTVYIADTGRKRVVMFGTDGSAKGEIGSAAAGIPEAARLQEPAGVAAGRDGSIYVSDAPARLIRRYAPAGRQQNAWGFGHVDAIDGPRLTVAPDGTLYATLPGACAVVQFGAAGNPLRSFGECSSADYLQRPGGLTFDDAGKLYVTDLAQGAVKVYQP